ncbi:MAG: TonB family protein [Pseudomonadota bacterium]|nr:TonB family protein [Pseudomonadota bacterium]
MRDGAEILALSAVTTVIALFLVPLPAMVGEEGSGASGEAVVSVAASSASVEQMVERWEAPPEVAVETPEVAAPPEMTAPVQPTAPSEPTPTARPLPMTPTAPTMSALPETDTAAPAPRHAPDTSPRPQRRPEPEPEPRREPAQVASQASQAQAEQRAQGQGQGGNAGQARQSQATATVSAATKRTLMSQWGGQIQGAIARRAPRGAGRGTAIVRLTVAANGALAGVALAQSSGNPNIDRLALQAVRTAGRFSPAPAGLGSGPFSFTVPIQSR